MFGKLKLGVKLIIYISLLLITTMTLISYITFNASRSELLSSISEKLNLVNKLKTEKINSYFSNVKSSFDFIENSKELHFLLSDFIEKRVSIDFENDQINQLQKRLVQENLITIQESYDFNRILVLTTKGEKIHETKSVSYLRTQDNDNFGPDSKFLIKARSQLIYSKLYKPTFRGSEHYMMVAAPIKNSNNTTIGIIACELNITPLFNLITDSTGLGSTGETFITQKVKNKIIYLSPLKFKKDATLSFEVSIGEPFGIPAQKSTQPTSSGFATEILDYNKNAVDAAWSYIPQFDWGIVTKINHEDSFKSILYLRVLITFLCCSIIFFAIIFIAIFVKRFLKPIIDIRDNMVYLAHGHFPENIEYDNQDEIKETTKAMNDLVTRLKHSTEFAQRIGKGELNISFEYAEGEDVLSRSLITMQESLSKIESENERRKWATEGIAIHAEVIRTNNESLKEMCKAFISRLVDYLGIQHGGLYVINFINDKTINPNLKPEDIAFELTAQYAYDLEITAEALKKYRLGQGLIGQCAIEKELIYIKHRPIEFTNISSGLGNAKAAHVILAPLMVNQDVMGIIELASFKGFQDHEIEFIKKVTDSIASAILSIKSSEHTVVLLEEARSITDTLKQKEQELIDQQTKMQEEINNLQEDIKVAQNIIKKLKKDS